MPTLYRTYRPQKFADITGQTHIVKTLTNELALAKTAQAYLFSGPRGTGKTTMARLLAKALNCEQRAVGAFEPCDQCSSCTEISAGRNIDVIEVDAASHTQVDNVRENIIENAQFKPTKSKFKVFIIDEVHMLSNSSFNALLKTLEEPPAHVVFILATTEAHKVLPTIVSRCQRFNFGKIKYDEMLDRLKMICERENIKVDKAVLNRVINKSDGCLRDAESLLGQLFSLNLKTITEADSFLILPTSDVNLAVGYAEALIDKNAADAFKIIDQLSADGVNLDQFMHDFIEILRYIMIGQAGGQTMATDYEEAVVKRLKILEKNISGQLLVTLIDRAMLRKKEIKSAPLPQLPLELLTVEFCGSGLINIASPVSHPPAPVAPPSTASAVDPTGRTNSDPPATFSQTIKSAISVITHHGAPIKSTLEEIQTHWPQLIKLIDETNHSLTFSLKLCTLKSVDNNGLIITVPYSLHRDKIEEKKFHKILEDHLSELCGERIAIRCDVEAGASVPKAEPARAVDIGNLAAEFGGEVVS
jgi:DNA polymerase-3 subunit gamma/tau